MIYNISTPDKVAWIYKELQNFCKKGNVEYSEMHMANFLRYRLSLNDPMFRVRVQKEKESGQIGGFCVYYIEQSLIGPKCFVLAFYAPKNKEAKKEMAEDIVKWTKQQNLNKIMYGTGHDPEFMINSFKELDLEFKVTNCFLEMEV